MVSETDSRVFNAIRFPLMVCVVFLHNSIRADFAIVSVLGRIAGLLCSAAVPCFFVISGYLFFNGMDTLSTWSGKLKRRAGTLLLPYIIWNVIMLAYLYLGELAAPQLASGSNIPVSSYTATDFLAAFWNIRAGMPVCYPLWYVRDLMAMCIAAPLIHFAIKKTGNVLPAVFTALYLSGIRTGIPGASETALEFFTLGAWLQMEGKSIQDSCSRIMPYALPIWIVCGVAAFLVAEGTVEDILYRITVLSGVAVLFGIFAKGAAGRRPRVTISAGCTFFVYGSHAIVLAIANKLLSPLAGTAPGATAAFLLSPVLATAVCVLLHAAAKKILPAMTSVMTGSRN